MDLSVLLVESNEILRKGMSCALARGRRIRRITEAAESARALAAAERERFAIAVVGMGLEEEVKHGLITALRGICKDTRCIRVVRGESECEPDRALRAEAAGIVSGDDSPRARDGTIAAGH